MLYFYKPNSAQNYFSNIMIYYCFCGTISSMVHVYIFVRKKITTIILSSSCPKVRWVYSIHLNLTYTRCTINTNSRVIISLFIWPFFLKLILIRLKVMPYKNNTLDDGDKYEYYDVLYLFFFSIKHISDYFSLPIAKSCQSFAGLTLFHIVHLYLILPYFSQDFILSLYCLPTLDQTCHRSFGPSFFHAWPVHWCRECESETHL